MERTTEPDTESPGPTPVRPGAVPREPERPDPGGRPPAPDPAPARPPPGEEPLVPEPPD